ncbi:MAG: hypothetical protein IKR39_07220 [Lachnospiraceae bacterium]|nr:hypothetical protein [Lachnospiraceae bacterium]
MGTEKDIEFSEDISEEKDSLSVVINILRWVGACLPLFITFGCLIEENALVAFIHLVAAFLVSPLSTRYFRRLGIRISTRLYVLIVVVWLIISGIFFFRMIDEEPSEDDTAQVEEVTDVEAGE